MGTAYWSARKLEQVLQIKFMIKEAMPRPSILSEEYKVALRNTFLYCKSAGRKWTRSEVEKTFVRLNRGNWDNVSTIETHLRAVKDFIHNCHTRPFVPVRIGPLYLRGIVPEPLARRLFAHVAKLNKCILKRISGHQLFSQSERRGSDAVLKSITNSMSSFMRELVGLCFGFSERPAAKCSPAESIDSQRIWCCQHATAVGYFVCLMQEGTAAWTNGTHGFLRYVCCRNMYRWGDILWPVIRPGSDFRAFPNDKGFNCNQSENVA